MLEEFNYYDPGSLGEVHELLKGLEGKTGILAGGTDLLVNMKKGLVHLENVIDIKGIRELVRLDLNDEGLFIGAAVTVNELTEDERVKNKYPLLVEAAKTLASHQIRNRATIVGNICNASPGADMAPALLVLGTKVLISGMDESREIPLDGFFTGVKETVLEDGEFVTGLRVEPALNDAVSKYLKKSRIKGPDLSAVGVAGLVSRGFKMVRFSYGAMAPTPVLIDCTDIFFESDSDFNNKRSRLLERVIDQVNPITDIRSTRDYRLRMAEVYTHRILSELWEEGVN